MISEVESIFATADRKGQGLTEFIRNHYDENQIKELESNIGLQRNSLRVEISEFMQEIEVPEIRSNLLSTSHEKLNQMQDNIKTNIEKIQFQLRQMGHAGYLKDPSDSEECFVNCNEEQPIEI